MGQLGRLHHGIGIPVAHGVLAHYALLEVGLHHPVVLGTRALGHLVVGDVGNLAELARQFLFGLRLLLLQLLVLLLEFSHACLHALGLLLLALLHEHADFASQFLGSREVGIQFGLCLPAHLVGGNHLVDSFLSTLEMLLLQSLDNLFGLFGNQF